MRPAALATLADGGRTSYVAAQYPQINYIDRLCDTFGSGEFGSDCCSRRAFLAALVIREGCRIIALGLMRYE